MEMGKGQIFSLDLLVSLVAVTLAVGLLIQIVETQTYNQKEEKLHSELRIVGETAANLLVSNPEIVCELVDDEDNPIGTLPNCIPKINANPYRIEKEKMGIPPGYNCKIDKDQAGGELRTGCSNQEIPDSAENVYSVTRKIALYSGAGSQAQKKKITKAELELCMADATDPNCELQESEITLWVWKA